jgi:D-alanyl-D-alanine carboxypeptidase
MKKILIIIISFIFMIRINAIEVDINSDYAFVYNVKENKIMSELDSNKQISVASLTKIMTAIIVIENTDLDEEVTIVDSDLRDMYVYATAGFTPGDKVTVKDFLV